MDCDQTNEGEKGESGSYQNASNNYFLLVEPGNQICQGRWVF